MKFSFAQVIERITEAFQCVLQDYIADEMENFKQNHLKGILELETILQSIKKEQNNYLALKFYQSKFDSKAASMSCLLSKKVQIRIKKKKSIIAQNIFNSLGFKVFVKENLVLQKSKTVDSERVGPINEIEKDNTIQEKTMEEAKESMEDETNEQGVPSKLEDKTEQNIQEIEPEKMEIQEEEPKVEVQEQISEELCGVQNLLKIIKTDFEGMSRFQIPKQLRKQDDSLKTVKIAVDQAWSDDPSTLMSSSRYRLTDSWKGYFLANDALDRWYSHPGVEWLTKAQFECNTDDWNGLPFAKFTYEAHIQTRAIKVLQFLGELRREMESHGVRSIELIQQI